MTAVLHGRDVELARVDALIADGRASHSGCGELARLLPDQEPDPVVATASR